MYMAGVFFSAGRWCRPVSRRPLRRAPGAPHAAQPGV